MKQGSKKDRKRARAIIEPLSPRVLYSVDLFGLGGDIGLPEETALQLESGLDNSQEDQAHQIEVVFVDNAVYRNQQIVDSLLKQSDQHTEYVIYTLTASQSVSDVDAILAKHNNLAAIHFITHGTDANFRLGSTIVDNQTLGNYTNSLNQWGAALADNGDILLYGCNLAETAEGKRLVSDIATATNADVGASDNRTGHESRNADWQLEYTVGSIDTDLTKIAVVLNDWESHLAPVSVTTLQDVVDGDVSSLAALNATKGTDGLISLREAVIAANADDTPDVITLAADTYILDAPFDARGDDYYGDLKIKNPLTIQGAGTDSTTGTTIEGTPTSRAVSILNANSVSLQHLIVSNGVHPVNGGGIYAEDTRLVFESIKVSGNTSHQGGGIFLDSVATPNSLNATFIDVEVSGNTATSQGGGLFVGSANVKLIDSTFINNTADDNDASNTSPVSQGGGAFVAGLLTTQSTSFTDNNSEQGGGVFVTGHLNASETLFFNNKATVFEGGALYITGTSDIERSLFNDNTADKGAGITNTGANTTVSNTTFSNNRADVYGGALMGTGGYTFIYSSTIADNHAPNSSAIYTDPGATVDLQGSLIARNEGNVDIHPGVSSKGFNLTDTTIDSPHISDQQLAGPGHIGLADNLDANGAINGNLVPTYKLLASSVGINAGPLVGNGTAIQFVDATGTARNETADIGAFEFRQNAPEVELYYGDYEHDTIHRINVSTDATQTIINSGIYPAADAGSGHDPQATVPIGLDIDSKNGKLYWLENDSYYNEDGYIGNLNVAFLNGPQDFAPQNLATDFKQPYGFAIDPTNDRLFISENLNPDNAPNQDKIMEYSTDGTFNEITLLDGTAAPNATPQLTPIASVVAIEYDAVTDTLYWADSGKEGPDGQSRDSETGIHSMDTNGNITTIVSADPNRPPYDFSLGPNGSIYWADGDDVFHVAADGTSISAPDAATISNTAGTVFKEPYAIEYSAENNKVYVSHWDENDDRIIWELDADTLTNGKVIVKGDIDPAVLASSTLSPLTTGPSVVKNVGIQMWEGDTPVIDFTNLMAVDPDTTAENLVYTVVNPSSVNGVLSVGWVPITATNNTFTQAEVNAGQVRYQDAGNSGLDTFSFYVSDGGTNPSAINEFNIDVTGVNDAPVLDNTDTFSFNPIAAGDTSPSGTTIADMLQLLPGPRISDADAGALEGIAVIAADETNGIWEFKATPSSAWAPVTSGTTGVVWDQNALLLNPSSLLRFIPTGVYTGAATIDFRAHDWTSEPVAAVGSYYNIQNTDISGSGSNSAAVGIASITVLNVAPVFGTIEPANAMHTENIPKNITDTLNITDFNDTELESATVRISNNFVAAEDELIFANTADITGDYNQSSGILTLTGTASINDYNAALQAVQYNNISDTPSTQIRTISFTANDGDADSAPLFRDIEIESVNDRPVFTNLDASPTYIAGTSAVYIDTDAAIQDPELDKLNGNNGNYSGSTLTIGRSNPDDQFYINVDTMLGAFGPILTPGGVRFADYTVSNGDLSIVYTDADGAIPTTDLVNRTLSELAYSNHSNTPATPITLSLTFTDNNTGTQGSGVALSANGTASLIVSIPPDFSHTVPIQVETNEDAPLMFTASDLVSIEDSSGKNYMLQTQLQVTNGVLTLQDTTNLAIVRGSNDSASIVVEGLRSDINNALNSLIFTPDSNYNNGGTIADTLTITSSINASAEAKYTFNSGDATDQNFGSSYDGVLIGDATTALSTSSNRYLSLDGDGDAVLIPTDYGISDAVSVLAWVNVSQPNPNGSNEMEIISIDDSVILRVNTDENRLSGLYKYGPTNYHSTDIVNDALFQGWHQIGYTLDTTTNRQAIYIDGVIVEETFNTDNILLGNPNPTTLLGERSGSSLNNLYGGIDGVHIFSRAISTEEIEARYAGAITDDAQVGVVVHPVNDIPVIDPDTSDSSQIVSTKQFTEGGGPIAITANSAVTDIDNNTVTKLNVHITNLLDGTDESLNATIHSGWAQSYNSNTGVLTVTPDMSVGAAVPATHANWENVIESLTYENTSADPNDTTREITLEIADGTDSNSPLAMSYISIQKINNPPTLASTDTSAVVFIENSNPISVSATQSIADGDSANIASATVSITNNYTLGEDELLFTTQGSIAGVFDSNTGILSISGDATRAEYDTALHSVQYQNSSDNPSPLTRTVEFQVSDGLASSNTTTRNIEIHANNDEPLLSAIEGDTVAYIENAAGAVITTSLSIDDVDDINIQSATISISNNLFAAEDELVVNNTLLNTLYGINASYNFASGELTFSGSSSIANYEAAIRTIEYRNNSENPTAVDRTISIVLNDANDDSNSLSRDVQITPVNDPPLSLASGVTISEDTPYTFLPTDFGFDDTTKENHALQSVIVDTNLYPQLSIAPGTSDIVYTPLTNSIASDQFLFKVQDNGGTTNNGIDTSTSAVMTITISPENDAPSMSNSSFTVAEDDMPSGHVIGSLLAGNFSDPDSADTLSGIAITQYTPIIGDGQWQYAVPGGQWQKVNQPSVVLSDTKALALDANTALRFVPALDYNGAPPALTIKGLDSTYGGAFSNSTQPERYIDVQNHDGTSPVSASAQIGVTVTPVPDTPVIDHAQLSNQIEDTQVANPDQISNLFQTSFSDADNTPMFGIAVTANNAIAAEGRWQYSIDGNRWYNVNNVSDKAALVLNKDTFLKFDPEANYFGTPGPLIAKAIDSDGNHNGSSTLSNTAPDRIIIDTTDGAPNFSSAKNISVTILSVNDAPSGANDLLAITSGTPTVLSMQNFGFADDVESDAFKEVIVDSVPGNGTLVLNGATVMDGQRVPATLIDTGQLSFITPLGHNAYQTDMTFRVVDSGGNANTGQDTALSGNKLSFDIKPPENNPPLSSDKTLSLREDTVYSFTPADFSFSDPADGHLFQQVSIVSKPTLGMLTLNSEEVLSDDLISTADLTNLKFTPAPSAYGTGYSTFEYNVIDNGPLAGGGSNTSATQTITFDVLPVNDAPIASDNTLQTVETDTLQLNVEDFGFSDLTEQHELQSVTVLSAPLHGTLQVGQTLISDGTIIQYADIFNGQLFYSPAPVSISNSDSDFFEFKVTDNGGNTNGGDDTSANAYSINIIIAADNIPPSGEDADLTMNEDEFLPLTADLFGYSDGADGDQMAGVIISALPVNGSLTLNNSAVQLNEFISTDDLNARALIFAPEQDAFATNYASLDFLVVDTGSSQINKHIATTASTLTISVLAVQDAPDNLAVNGSLSVAENSTTTDIGSVVFSDVDPNDTHVVSVNDDRFDVINGILALKPGITIDHESEDVIPLQLTVTDQAGNSAIHDFIVQISDVNEAPIVSQGIDEQNGEGSFSFAVPVNAFFDIDGDTLSLSATLADGSPLPSSWLQFDPEKGEFTISEDEADSDQPVSVMLTATDPSGLATSTVFDINVGPSIEAAYSEPSPFIPQILSEEETQNETTETAQGNEEPQNVDEQLVDNELFPSELQSSRDDKIFLEEILSEVVQFETTKNITSQTTLRPASDPGVKNHNEFQLNTQVADSTTSAQQKLTELNNLSLKNLSEKADTNWSEIAKSQAIETKVLASSVTLSSSLSVGYILWLLRGGTLLASVMATLPAWRVIDPLPVLETLAGDDEDDTETLESMVESEDDEQKEPEKK